MPYCQGRKTPRMVNAKRKTPTIADHQTRALLAAPDATALRGKRNRAITLLDHGLRRTELCALSVDDVHSRRGVMHLRIYGKVSKLRDFLLHPSMAQVINDYLQATDHVQSTPKGCCIVLYIFGPSLAPKISASSAPVWTRCSNEATACSTSCSAPSMAIQFGSLRNG